jgi:hypothetical protein
VIGDDVSSGTCLNPRHIDVDCRVRERRQSKPATRVCHPHQPWFYPRNLFLLFPCFKGHAMVLLAFYPRLSCRTLYCRTPPHLCGDDHQYFLPGAIRRGTLHPQLPVSHLRFLRCCLHYRGRSWHKWKGPLSALNQSVCENGRRRKPPYQHPGSQRE